MLFKKLEAPYTPTYLEWNEFTSNCGISTLDFFPSVEYGKTTKEMQEIVAKELDYYKPQFNSIMMVSLTTRQRTMYSKVLTDRGFQIILQGCRNKNSGNNLTVYAWRHDGRTPHGKAKKKGKPSVASNRRHRGGQPLSN